MNTTQMRSEAHQIIDLMDDRFLEVVHAMLQTYAQQQEEDQIVGYTTEGQPIYASEAKEEYARRVAEMKAGHKTTIEDLRKEAGEW